MEARVDRADPISKAFCLLKRIAELSDTMKAFHNKLEEMEISLHKFTVKMLDLCNGKDQVRATKIGFLRGSFIHE